MDPLAHAGWWVVKILSEMRLEQVEVGLSHFGSWRRHSVLQLAHVKSHCVASEKEFGVAAKRSLMRMTHWMGFFGQGSGQRMI